MSTSDTCANCRYFKPNAENQPQGGTCLRFPPLPMAVPQQNIIGSDGMALAAFNPPVTLDHTCGEHVTVVKLHSVGSDESTGGRASE